ncbi:MAG: exopolyphosphatase [Planctomycetota bacterium]|nr:MAG: exopolyphosphatase [Planctomycetota bacterium]
MSASEPTGLAAVDLGSNSFHMVLAQLVDGEPLVVDRLREQVQLAEGLEPDGSLAGDARRRALACLERFGERLRHAPGVRVRAVGTNTLRVASNARQFLVAAEAALGWPIEVVSGQEEARLIYLGAAHSASDDAGHRLVVDIGGGSTECILGQRFEILSVHSLFMGCVQYSRRFFRDGRITKRALSQAELAAGRELLALQHGLRELGWQEAVGCSGTIRACESVLVANDWSSGGVTRDGLQRLREALLAAGHSSRLELPGLKPERAPVLAGGVAILLAVFNALKLDLMHVAQGALREGVLYDLLGRIRHEDVRERTIRLFQERYHVDRDQAARVEATALALFEQVAAPWKLQPRPAGAFLSWAARLHEVGLGVSFRHHHRHGAYLLSESDMPGLSRDDQRLLAAVVGAHRRRVGTDAFACLMRKGRSKLARKLAVLLRLAVVLNRPRSGANHADPRLEVDGEGLKLTLPEAWLRSRPLTRSDLEHEVKALRDLGSRLELAISS